MLLIVEFHVANSVQLCLDRSFAMFKTNAAVLLSVLLASCGSLETTEGVSTKEALTAALSQLSSPNTINACEVQLSGGSLESETIDIARSPKVAGVSKICLDLEQSGIVVAKKDDDTDIEVPVECDERMGQVSIGCFRNCLELSNFFASEDQTLEEWREDGDFCASSCEIGCDGRVP